jgi:DNA-binding CsgD family transcriptional regulator
MAAAENYSEVFQNLRNLDDLQQVLGRVSRSFGFQNFVYHVVRPPVGGRRLRLSGIAKIKRGSGNGQDGCGEQEGFNGEEFGCPDSLLEQLGNMTVPYRWDQFEGAAAEREFLARFFGGMPDTELNFGVTVPLHGPAGGLAALCFASHRIPPALDGNWAACRDDLILVGSYAHQAAQNGFGRAPADSPHLTARESEILLWTARGKTAWEIGEILEISDETVRFHLKNATRKFGVFSKHQAVVQAIVGGMIVP